MATVHPEKAVSAKTAFIYAMYAEGLLTECADQFQQELTMMTSKEASTTRLRKTSTKSAVNPQTVTTATSDENKASIEAGIRRVIPEASRPFLFRIYAKHCGSTTDDHHIAS